MNKKIVALIIIAAIPMATIIQNKIASHTNHTLSLKIGILQTASHPALDAARDGFIAQLKEKSGDSIECVTYNAQGSIITAHTIAQKLHADDSIAAIYAIATPALQAIAAVEKEKPIIIAAVTDPYALGIITEKSNIGGITDMIDIVGTVNAIQTILPDVATIALVYNPSEHNSKIQASLLEKELNKHSITTIHVGITSEAEIPQAIASALSKADALLTPTDNLVASAMPLISHLTRSAHKPLIACHNQAVEQGALMARGVDYYESGKAAGEIAIDLLHKEKKSYNLAVSPITSDTIVINKKVLDELDITIGKISDTIVYIH